MSKSFFEPLETRQLLSLVIDVRLTGGGKTAMVSNVGDVVNMDVWATATGANGSGADEGLQIVDGSFLSTNASGGAANGTLQATRVSPFNASGSSNGTQVDLDGDGDLDVGSNTDSSATGFFFARSASLNTSGTISGNNQSWKIGTLKFTVTSLKSLSGQTNINFRIRNWVSGALWREDGNAILKNGLSGYTAGAPVVIKTTTSGTPDIGVISGKVFNDNNANGNVDSGETGRSGVLVFLDANKNGVLDTGETTKTTDSSGNYTFTGLSVGTHRIRLATVPAGTAITQPSTGFHDVSLNNNTSSGKNFGLKASTSTTGSISGIVFSDNNANGNLDSGESLLSRNVYIDANNNGKFDTGEKSTFSNASGVYTFTGLAAGTYRIGRSDLPGGYYISTGSGGFQTVNLGTGQNVSGINIGAALGSPSGNNGSISGTVFNDGNENGAYNAGESLLSNRRIYIDSNNNGKFDSGEPSVFSNASGVYTFSGLASGTYRIGRADTPGGYFYTTSATGIHTVNLASGQNVSNINIGVALGTPTGNNGSISGRVFNDGNENGVYNTGESLLANRKVFIDANNNGKFDSGEPSVFTNSSGVYTFSGLAAGTYRISRADLPGGYYYTTSPSTGLHVVNLGSGQSVSNIDVGVALGTPSGGNGSISGRVFNDGNQNGDYNSGESLLANRKVFIDSNNNGKFDSGEPSIFTNSSGVYTFTNLPAGTYRISRADLPGGYYYTTSPSTGFHVVNLGSGQSVSSIDLGVALGSPSSSTGSISGTVFNDGNKNGSYNSGESLLASRKIYIDANNNGKLDSGEVSVFSNASGVYTFSNLGAGTYYIRRGDLPGGYYQTTPVSNVWTVVLGGGQDVTGRDFGAALL